MFDSFEIFNRYKDGGLMALTFVCIVLIAASGIFFGILNFTLGSVQTGLESTDCVIEDNTLVDSCQDLFALSFYPFLNLKDLLVWASFMFIFGLAFGMLFVGYRSGESPVLMGFLVVIVIIMTYLSIEISNLYRTLLENDIFRSFMVDFVVYNRVMLNFPWFIFILTAMCCFLAIVNFQRSAVNKPTDTLNY